jgi:hypothetical protein
MKNTLLAAILSLTATGAMAGPVMVGADEGRNEVAVYELYRAPGKLPECKDTSRGAFGMTLKVQTWRGTFEVGTGCWTIANNGHSIDMLIRTTDDGRYFSVRRHISTFKTMAPTKIPSSIQTAIHRVDVLAQACDANRDKQSCGTMAAAVDELASNGWCWGPDDAAGTDKRWMRCE